MPQHIWSVLCQKGILDRYTNAVSLFEIIEGVIITPKSPPPSGRVNIPASMHLVSLWCRSDRGTPESFEARSVVILPSGSEVAGLSMQAGLQEHRRIRTFMRLEAMPFEGAGQYGFAVEYRGAPTEQWTRVATVPVEVEVAPQSAGQAEQAATVPAQGKAARSRGKRK